MTSSSFFPGWDVLLKVALLGWVSGPCAQQSNETFPVVSETMLSPSQTGGPLGHLVSMLGYNCTVRWQVGGTWSKTTGGIHGVNGWPCRYLCFFVYWRLIIFNPPVSGSHLSPLIPQNNRLYFVLLCPPWYQTVKQPPGQMIDYYQTRQAPSRLRFPEPGIDPKTDSCLSQRTAASCLC